MPLKKGRIKKQLIFLQSKYW